MGIIVDQSFKNLITTYFGFAIGAINVLLLYPNFFTPKHYGLITFLLSASTLLWPIMSFGVNHTLIKFYSGYTKQIDKQGLLSLAMFLPLGVGLILGLFGLFFNQAILGYFTKNPIVQPYVWLIFVIAIFSAYFEVFYAWAKLKYKSVFGNFMREVFHRVCVSILLVLVYLEIIGIESFVYLLTGVYFVRALIIKIYAFSLIKPSLKFRFPHNKIEVFKYSFLIFIVGSIAIALLDLDKVMIEHYLPIEQVSIYGIAVYVATVIAVPARAMNQISHPITANLLNNKNFEELRTLYTKSSVSLLVVSGLIFVIIVTNINQVYALMPEIYQVEIGIILLLALIKLSDNMLGNANSILFNSNYYKLILLLSVGLIVFAFLTNLWLIPKWGLVGAAVASFITFIAYNITKLLVVLQKFKMHPFSKNTAFILLFIALFTVGFYYIDFNINPVINILLKSGFISVLYVFLAYKLNFSEDINLLIKKFLRKVFAK